MRPEFRFRLNGVVMQQICVQQELADEQMTGRLQLCVHDEDLGWFAIDDNEELTDESLPKFRLEYRNETEWGKVHPDLKRRLQTKGWKRASTIEAIAMLQSAG